MYTPFAYAFVYAYDYLRTGLSDMTTDPSTMPASDDTHGIFTYLKQQFAVHAVKHRLDLLFIRKTMKDKDYPNRCF